MIEKKGRKQERWVSDRISIVILKDMIKYTLEDYEFAVRVLHHRKEIKERELKEWMKSPEHLELLEELAAVRMAAEDIPAISKKQGWDRLYKQLNRNRRIRWVSGVAALVMIALGVWQLLVTMTPEGNVVVAEQAEIIPGQTKAQLIMVDGRVVDLGGDIREIAHTEIGVVRDDPEEGLKYQLKAVGCNESSEKLDILQVPAGGFYKLELSDGTKVWLNAKSELRFPAGFSQQERNVYLKGEGYFEVAREEHRPFRVHLEQSTVTVLGTAFNISAYEDEAEVYTTLVNGSVQFQPDKGGDVVVMTKGFQCTMDRETGRTSLKKVDTDIYTAWVDGRFVFRFMNLETIIRQLQRWYDFEVVWNSPEVNDYEFQGAIQRDSRIEDVFKAIELTTDAKFNITGKRVTVEKK